MKETVPVGVGSPPTLDTVALSCTVEPIAADRIAGALATSFAPAPAWMSVATGGVCFWNVFVNVQVTVWPGPMLTWPLAVVRDGVAATVLACNAGELPEVRVRIRLGDRVRSGLDQPTVERRVAVGELTVTCCRRSAR